MHYFYPNFSCRSTEGNEALSPPARQPNPQQTAASKRLQHTQAQVDEVNILILCDDY